MFELNFTTGVLGPVAVERLKKHRMLLTIRSQSSRVVLAWQNAGITTSDEVSVLLDGNKVGRAFLAYVTPVDGSLNANDALIGGFPSLADLQKALKRAGYRFKPLSDYQLYRVRFTWIEEVPA